VNGHWSPQFLARLIGILVLISLIFGGFGEIHIPGTIMVDGDAGAAVGNIVHHETLFRLGFAAYTVDELTGRIAIIVAPDFASPVFFLPTLLTMLALAVWLLTRGVDEPQWEQNTARRAPPQRLPLQRTRIASHAARTLSDRAGHRAERRPEMRAYR